MTAQIIATYFVCLSLIIGSGFVLVGGIGLLKFNDPMTRLHAPTKVGTVGIGMLLLASIVHSFNIGKPSKLIYIGGALGAFAIIGFILELVFIVIASLKARDGELYQYPLTINFLK